MAKRASIAGVLAILFGTLLLPAAVAAPEPEPVARRWEYRVEPGELRVACVELPETGPRSYYYMTYLVINTTGQDRFFAPSFEVATDRGEIVRSGRGVPPRVADELLERLGNTLLLNEIDIQGLLLQGEENAKEGLVIWRADDLMVDEVTVYAAGFSGETRAVKRPDNDETVLLRKTLMLRHATPGDLDCSDHRPLDRTVTRWIMRASSPR